MRHELLSRKDLMGCASLHPSYGFTGLFMVSGCPERDVNNCLISSSLPLPFHSIHVNSTPRFETSSGRKGISIGRNQDVRITAQFTLPVKIGIHCGSLHNHRLGERQYSARSTQLFECVKLFCAPLASRPRRTSYRVITEKVNCRWTSR